MKKEWKVWESIRRVVRAKKPINKQKRGAKGRKDIGEWMREWGRGIVGNNYAHEGVRGPQSWKYLGEWHAWCWKLCNTDIIFRILSPKLPMSKLASTNYLPFKFCIIDSHTLIIVIISYKSSISSFKYGYQ